MIIKATLDSEEIEFEISAEVNDSQVEVKVTSDHQITEIQTLRDTVNRLLSHFTDSFGYYDGYWSEIELTSVFDEMNDLRGSLTPKTANYVTDSKPVRSGFELAYLASNVKFDALRLALRDLRHAIKYQQDTAVYCYRAIESIMQFFNDASNSSEERKQAWLKMNTSLNVSKNWIQYVSNFALDPRHGRPKGLVGSQRTEIMERTSKIIDRFIVYVKNGEKPLDKTIYPEL